MRRVRSLTLVRACREAGVRAAVAAAAPGARVLAAVHCRVPLSELLDVEPAPEVTAVTHDRLSAPVLVAPVPGRLRGASRLPGGGPVGGAAPHAAADGYTSLCFASDAPLRLAAFQDWVTAGLPPAAARVKGVVRFAEDLGTAPSSTFHMSGRRRLAITLDEGGGGGAAPAAGARLAVIGRCLDAETVRAQFAALVAPTAGADGGSSAGAAAVARARDAAAARVAADARLELRAPRGAAGSLVHFRVTGALPGGVSAAAAEAAHGVDFGALNEEVVGRANARGGGRVFASTDRDPSDGALLIRFDVGGALDFGGVLDALLVEAAVVAPVHLARIPH